MASMVVIFRGKSNQTTVLDVAGLNDLENSYYVRLNNTIWLDPLTSASQWHDGYSQPSMTAATLLANGALKLNETFGSKEYPQAVNLYRTVDFPLIQNPVLSISVEASVGIHYGIRITGEDNSGSPLQAWSESSYLQHRPGLGRPENFTLNAVVEAYKVNGVFPTAGSKITNLLFYIEASPGQSGQFSLNVYGITAVTPNRYSFNPANEFRDKNDGVILMLNLTNSLGYSDDQFAQGYVDYYISGTADLLYTVYYMHGPTVVGQGYDYSANGLTHASFSGGKVTNSPPFLTGGTSFSIILAPKSGSFLSFQLEGYSVRYLSQAPVTTTPTNIDASTIVAFYFVFLFVTPTAIVILVSRLFSHETKQSA